MGLLLLAAVAGLAAVERKGFFQAMLSRPAVLGPLAGMAVGDASAGLLVGVPLELLFLGAVNLGAALPLHEALCAAAAAGGAALGTSRYGLPAPAAAAVACAAGLPLAVAGRGVDALVERANDRLAARAARRLEAGDPAAAMRCNLLGLALPFALGAALAPLGAGAAAGAAAALLRAAPGLARPLALAFAAFAALACAAGVRALRAGGAPRTFYAAALLALGVAAAGGRMAQ
ncbi:MAG TPA: PTS sugar transporter subunit IIC [Anaeromyxobacteraceae bacterium]